MAFTPYNSLGIRPQDISLDTQGLPYSWQPVVVPETPYDASMPPGPVGLPEHIEILFGVTDPADRKYIGAMVFSGATKTGPNVWEGRVKNLEDGETYMGKITLNGANTVTLDGCVLGGAICKGETWTRAR